jgi:hypothetical protein
MVNSQSYLTSTIEGNTETFRINITTGGLQISTANLIYNTTTYSGSLLKNGFQYNVTVTLSAPSVNAPTSQDFYWSFTFQDSSVKNTSAITQTVYPLQVGICNSTIKGHMINITMKDERTREVLNGVADNTTVEIDLDLSPYGSTTPIISFNSTQNETNPFGICITTLNASSRYRLDSVFKYKSEDRVEEYYHIQNFTVTSSSIPRNISLFDLATTESQEFQITYKNENFLPVENALIDIQRQYVSLGKFLTVEIPKTDTNGQTISHLVPNSEKYNFRIYKEGVLLARFDNVIPFCDNIATGDCTLNLNEKTSTTQIRDFNRYKDLAYFTDFDKATRTITTTFSTLSGISSEIKVNATKFDNYGNTTVCSDRLVSSSGTLTCVIPNSFGNVTVVYNLYNEDELVTTSVFSIKSEPGDIYGDTAIVLMVIVLMIFPMMFITSKIGVVIGVLFSLIIGLLLFVITGASWIGAGSAFLWVIVSAGILIWALSKSEETR